MLWMWGQVVALDVGVGGCPECGGGVIALDVGVRWWWLLWIWGGVVEVDLDVGGRELW